jgi:hypothetical protein
MSTEELAEGVGEVANRSGFLARISAATLTLLGIAGLTAPKAGAIWNGHGCGLCGAPSSCGPEENCTWCWIGTCHNHGGVMRKHRCCEGYRQHTCNGTCPAYCSFYFDLLPC